MKFKGTRCIEITKTEYDDIMFINSISTCTADAEDKVTEYLIRDKKINTELPNYIIRQAAYKLYQAVINNYNYLKVVD